MSTELADKWVNTPEGYTRLAARYQAQECKRDGIIPIRSYVDGRIKFDGYVELNARNLYRWAYSAWRLSVRDGIAEDSLSDFFVQEWLGILTFLNAQIVLRSQPNYLALLLPEVADKSIHYYPNYWRHVYERKHHAS